MNATKTTHSTRKASTMRKILEELATLITAARMEHLEYNETQKAIHVRNAEGFLDHAAEILQSLLDEQPPFNAD